MSFKNDSLIRLVIDQINYDQEMGQQDALYDFLDHIGREQMIDYLSQTRLDSAMEQGVIDESEYMMRKWGDES
jgi:hypothetical protein